MASSRSGSKHTTIKTAGDLIKAKKIELERLLSGDTRSIDKLVREKFAMIEAAYYFDPSGRLIEKFCEEWNNLYELMETVKIGSFDPLAFYYANKVMANRLEEYLRKDWNFLGFHKRKD